MFKFDITWFLAALSLSGNVFNIKKSVVCFYIWAVGELFWMILDIYNGVYGRAFLDLTQLCFALWGIYEWGIKKERDKREKNRLKQTS